MLNEIYDYQNFGTARDVHICERSRTKRYSYRISGLERPHDIYEHVRNSAEDNEWGGIMQNSPTGSF